MRQPHSQVLKRLHIAERRRKAAQAPFLGLASVGENVICGETGITSLIKQRLVYEASNLHHVEDKLGSLIVDEMSIKAKVMYDRNLDQFLGYTEAEIEELGPPHSRGGCAVRLLAFHQGELGSIPGPGHSGFSQVENRAGRCRWFAWFSWDLPFPPPLHSDVPPYSLRFTLIGSQYL
ncbi:hypothetical protein PR048_010103 [Dryococelus australis]|uniref:Transposable element P transposase-like RNase H domain-containing protein n=1 Tax=Dryococelus australis TaxID=614101 RepID=A0ABQ9I1S6_9NEOP|nr:hypothetical protein PR048_010103 [Dryococelus australis]